MCFGPSEVQEEKIFTYYLTRCVVASKESVRESDTQLYFTGSVFEDFDVRLVLSPSELKDLRVQGAAFSLGSLEVGQVLEKGCVRPRRLNRITQRRMFKLRVC